MNESVLWDTGGSRRRAAPGALAVLLVLSAWPAVGQSVPGTAAVTETATAAFPSTVAFAAVEAGPLLDGDVLGDPAWIDVPAATGFVQTQPDEGQPATERTEVRVLFDDDTIYFGFVCYDRDPDGIITSESRRDASLSNSDSIQAGPLSNSLRSFSTPSATGRARSCSAPARQGRSMTGRS